MDKNRTSRSHRHHIDCSQQDDNSHLIAKDQSECYHRNNHNSGLIQHDELIKSTSEIVPRKRRVIPYHHRSQSLSSSTLLILIRLMILVIFSLIVYYIFLYIYSKPKQNGWERILDWLMRE
jgi:ABC-type multidrug transport system permease subunit